MSPEQAAGEPELDARTDVYSLGAVLYEMLAGEPPFTGATAQAMIAKRLSEPPPSVRRVRPERAGERGPGHPAGAGPGGGRPIRHRGRVRPGAPGRRNAATADRRRRRPATAADRRRTAPGRRPVPVARDHPGRSASCIGLGVLFAWRHSIEAEAPAPAAPTRVLAVLPFENLGDSADAYFADGVTDEVRGKLSALPGLQVIAEHQLQRVQGQRQAAAGRSRGSWGRTTCSSARSAGRRRPGGSSRVRVSPELVDVGPGRRPKANGSSRSTPRSPMSSRCRPTSPTRWPTRSTWPWATGQKQTLTERPTANLAAYDAFLKGEASGGLDRRRRARRSRRASSSTSRRWRSIPPSWRRGRLSQSAGEVLLQRHADPRGRREPRSAPPTERSRWLPSRPEGWLALCEYYSDRVMDYERALEACRKGLALAPGNAELLTAAALAEQGLGRWEAALRSLENGRRAGPASATRRGGWPTPCSLRRYPEALAAADRGLAVSTRQPRSDREQGHGLSRPG